MKTAPRFQLGAFECLSVSDGTALYNPRAFFTNAPRPELDAALVPYPLEKDKLRTPFHCLVVRTGSQMVLVDTGLGPCRASSSGQLIAHLAAEGIASEAIDLVILSHLHSDHVGGALDAEGRPAFPQARYVLSETEWTFWQSEAAPVQTNETAAQAARTALAGLQPVLERIVPPLELLPGVQVIPAPGHTPGQIAVRFTSENRQMLYLADVIAHPLHLSHPEWNIIADLDRAQALRTRRDLLGRAVTGQAVIYVYHFEDPFAGMLRENGSGWELTGDYDHFGDRG